MFFAPYVIRGSNAEKVLVQILPASPEDLAATKGTPSWQTDWESEYLSQPSVDKFALKLDNGELLALGAYQISGRKAYVYILYVESAPQSNPTLTTSARRILWHRRGDDRFRHQILDRCRLPRRCSF